MLYNSCPHKTSYFQHRPILFASFFSSYMEDLACFYLVEIVPKQPTPLDQWWGKELRIINPSPLQGASLDARILGVIFLDWRLN